MLDLLFVRVVAWCTRHAWVVIIASVLLGIGSAIYSARHFAVNTDVDRLLSPDLPWRQRYAEYEKAFPQNVETILAVVKAPTPEFAEVAARELADRLAKEDALFWSVRNPQGSEFFVRNSLLYLPTDEVASTTEKLVAAAPLVRTLVGDPSIRGLVQFLQTALQGLRLGRYSVDDLTRPLNLTSDVLDQVLAGHGAAFSWRELVSGTPPKPEDLRQLLILWPKLDYNALQPGHAAIDAIRRTAAESDLPSAFKADVRLTGPVAIADEEFATLREGVELNGVISTAIALVILWLALRWLRLTGAVVASVVVGLAVTAALGLRLVGALNPISVAFAVLFVGVGADFAIQYSIRYRAERYETKTLREALTAAAESVGAPLTLAAAAAAAGFLSFLPTDYTGLAELGLIAGLGMVVAYVAAMTLLPALIFALRPPPEPNTLGLPALAPADRFLQHHRILVVAGTSIVALAGLPALVHLQFDFNPISVRDRSSEPIATLNELRGDPRIERYAAQVLVAPTDVEAMSEKLSALPEVARVRRLASFIPDDQDRKLALINAAAPKLDPALNVGARTPPTDAENVAALEAAAKTLQNIAASGSGSGAAAASRLASDLTNLAQAQETTRHAAAQVFLRPLQIDLDDLRRWLRPQRVTRDTLPPDLVRDWVTPDGRERLEVAPKGDADDSEILRRFATAVLAVAPDATGEAITTYEWGRAILKAFAQAGAWALFTIAILLWIVLRRMGDVLLTLIPLLVAAAVTLEICALTGFRLNYANIIALPLLLGVGVAFKIYYVMAWRRGEINFLQSPLTRAVFFSALMTATAFGSLWLSRNPGISSMGKLLALSLVCTLAAAALFQPALMGPPREQGRERKAEPLARGDTQ